MNKCNPSNYSIRVLVFYLNKAIKIDLNIIKKFVYIKYIKSNFYLLIY